MAPIVFPVGIIVVALVAVMVMRRHQNIQEKKSVAVTEGGVVNHPPSPIPNALKKARQIIPPVVSLQKGGEFEHGEFWGDNDAVLKAAWKEWWYQNRHHLPELTHASIIHPTLMQAVQQLRQDPTEDNEAALKSLFEQVLPGQVYQIPFLSQEGVVQLRQHLDASSYYYTNSTIQRAGIPTRRPNGMNRYGVILDESIEGAVSYEGITTYALALVHDFVRPLSRMLFPQMTSRFHPEDDEESYAFTIRYRHDLDMALAEHSDASVYTININLNLPEKLESDDNADVDKDNTTTTTSYHGSSLYFVDPLTQQQQHVSFSPGMAVMHRGLIRHAALPITKGERHNLVIWLFGRHAYVRIAEYDNPMEHLTVKERWG